MSTSKVNLIRAEVERLLAIADHRTDNHSYIIPEGQEWDKEEEERLRGLQNVKLTHLDGEACAYQKILSFIDSLPDVSETDFGKKNVGEAMEELEEKIALYEKNHPASVTYEAEVGNGAIKALVTKELSPVSNDLEEAAKEYRLSTNLNHERYGEFGSNIINAFIAGALWQKEKMIRDSVEREVKVDAGSYPYIDATELYDYDEDKPLAKEGDKVKLIIVREDGNS